MMVERAEYQSLTLVCKSLTLRLGDWRDAWSEYKSSRSAGAREFGCRLMDKCFYVSLQQTNMHGILPDSDVCRERERERERSRTIGDYKGL